MMHFHRHGRRFSVAGPNAEVVAFARQMIAAGQRVRLIVVWANSFHDPDFRFVALHGPAVRNPHMAHEINRVVEAAERQLCVAFRFSRRAD